MKHILIIVFLFLALVAISSTDAQERYPFLESELIGIAHDILDVRDAVRANTNVLRQNTNVLRQIESYERMISEYEGMIYEAEKIQTTLLIQIRENTSR